MICKNIANFCFMFSFLKIKNISFRFYEKVVRWFQRRGRNLPTETFPSEKHCNVHHSAVLATPHLVQKSSPKPSLKSTVSILKQPSIVQVKSFSRDNSLATSEATSSIRSVGPSPQRMICQERISPGHPSHSKVRGALSSTTSTLSSGSATAPACSNGQSMESGYYSFSTCSSPAVSVGRHSPSFFKRDRRSRFRFLSRALKIVKGKGKSLSEEVPEVKPREDIWNVRSIEDNVADGKRRLFQSKQSMFHSAVDEEENIEMRCSSRASSSYNSSVFSGSLNSLSHSDTHEMVALTLGDFRFKYSELEFHHSLTSGSGGQIHTGKCQVWDVNIHSSVPKNDEEVREWLSDVRRLTQIRHENIVLYMGACVEPPKFAIITSLINCESLYAHTVFQGSRLRATKKLSILRQTANALSYLHCKGIVHGRLSSHNIFLETTVKVSLLDYGSSSLNLQFYSPEIVRNITSDDRSVWEKSKKGDVFAFGSVIYQLSTQKLPLDNHPSQTVLYQMGLGYLAKHLPSAHLNPGLSRIIDGCWNQDPEKRPTFPELCRQLLPLLNSIGARRHSLSEPRSLDKVGQSEPPRFLYTEKHKL